MSENQRLKALYERYVRNECSREELELFFQLVNKLENEEEIRALLSRSWDKWPEETSTSASPSVFRKLLIQSIWLRVAAVVVFLAGAVLLAVWLMRLWQQPKLISHRTGPREQLAIQLPDSSTVWLQASGKLSYQSDFQGQAREVYLDGRAVFDVEKDSEHPFLVHSGDITTSVLGTTFDVTAYAADTIVQVTVISGRVQVASHGKILDELDPSEQIRYNVEGGSFYVANADTVNFLARTRGAFHFDAMPLGQIATELERWYDVTIRIDNPELRECRYTASFADSLALDQLLSVLCEVNNIRYRVNEQDKTVSLNGEGCL